MLILPSRGLIWFFLAVSPSPEHSMTHSNSASVSVRPRLNTMFGHFIRPSSLCVYAFWPPSASSSTSSCTASPDTSVNAPMSRSPTLNRNLPTKGGSMVYALATLYSLPRAFVQAADLLQEADPVAVLQVEQPVEVPVQVVRQEGDLLPQLVVGVVP